MSRHIFFYLIVSIYFFSCKPVSYFKTPNDVSKVQAIVHTIKNGDIDGKITVELETRIAAQNFIIVNQNNIDLKVPIDSILYYKIGNDFYFPKKVDLDLNGVQRLLFVKRLTSENSKIDLFELLQSQKVSDEARDTYYYFLSFPDDNRFTAYNVASKKFVPNFNEKMSKIVSDCKELSDKIEQKEKGYFFPQIILSDVKKKEIYLRIINEYNQCE